jgi:hypothetical protein
MIEGKEKVELVQTWNTIVHALIKARDNWKRLRDILIQKPSLDGFNYRSGKIFSLIPGRSKFEIGLPRFVDIWRSSGGLEEFLVTQEIKEEKKEEKVKEMKDGRRK